MQEKDGRITELEEALRESIKITAQREVVMAEQQMKLDHTHRLVYFNIYLPFMMMMMMMAMTMTVTVTVTVESGVGDGWWMMMIFEKWGGNPES